MHVEYAQLPPPEDSADRIFIAHNAVIVLDGATAFVPVPVSAQTYADQLGRRLVEQLETQADAILQEALASAIRKTAEALGLVTGESPSATVAILRQCPEHYDLLVLGDSAVVWGTEADSRGLRDYRIDQLQLPQRQHYRTQLQAGRGYNSDHLESLRALQTEQARRRNTHTGYWIAEADPEAARHALVKTVARSDLTWAVIATDGAFELLEHQGRGDWQDIGRYTSAQLAELLDCLHAWERDEDPDGQHLPRAKRHDDKTIVTVRNSG